MIRQFIHSLRPTVAPQPELSPEEMAIRSYLENGRKPWSHGYVAYRDRFSASAIRNRELLHLFRTGAPLPRDYGFRLDERVVTIPWTLAHLAACGPHIFDAGAALNHSWILEHLTPSERTVTFATSAPDTIPAMPNVSYLCEELRKTSLSEGSVDAVTCVGVVERIGTNDATELSDQRPAYRDVLHEFRRVLRPEGVLLLTVAFGKAEHHGWIQQFDRSGIEAIVESFGGRLAEWHCYRYYPGGWRTATVQECADCSYVNRRTATDYRPDYAAAARAVACLRLIRA